MSTRTRTLTHLADLIRGRRARLRSRWRRLDPGSRPCSYSPTCERRHLHPPDAGFGIGTTTAWRYIREAVDLLAATAAELATAMCRVSRLAYAILDGTLIPIDRVADDRPYC